MSSSYNNNNNNNKNYKYAPYDPSLADTNTTFVQADPSNFRAVVQQLTGSSSISNPPTGLRRGTGLFKLHERRQQQGVMRKLEMIKLNDSNNNYQYNGPLNGPSNGLMSEFVRPKRGNYSNDMVSPISTLDGLGLEIGSPSPRNSIYSHGIYSSNDEKERAIIVEKGFYLHNNNNNARTNCHEPKLLPLFPLHSPRDNY